MNAHVLLRTFFACAIASTLACGGATTGSGGDAGSLANRGAAIDSGDDAGSLAPCGSGCSPSRVAASCSTFCAKFAAAACPSSTPDPSCNSRCAAIAAMTAPCASVVVAFLSCTESVQPLCTSMGTVFPGCDAQEQAANACLNDAGPSSPPLPDPCVPDTVCPAIPRPTSGTMSCSASASVGPGDGSPTTTMCQDARGNTWEADCTGSSCTCTYNGGLSCGCTARPTPGGTCGTCCPGTS